MNQDEHVRQNLEIVSDSLPGGMTAQEEQIRRSRSRRLQRGPSGEVHSLRLLHALPGRHRHPRRVQESQQLPHAFPSGGREWATPCFWGCRRRTANRTGPPTAPIAESARKSVRRASRCARFSERVQKDLEGPLVKMMAVGGRAVLNRGKKNGEPRLRRSEQRHPRTCQYVEDGQASERGEGLKHAAHLSGAKRLPSPSTLPSRDCIARSSTGTTSARPRPLTST